MSGYVAESCDQLDKFLKHSQAVPICLSVLVLFYVSKLEVNLFNLLMVEFAMVSCILNHVCEGIQM